MESILKLRFSLIDYLEYINGNENSRTVCEGEQVLNAGHLILCGVLEEAVVNITVYALCLQTSALQEPPHEIYITFCKLEDGKCKVTNATCSCKAGQGSRCKHISAVLIMCTRKSLSDMEKISQADISCTWADQKKDTQEKYKAVPINEMPCFKDKAADSFKINDDILAKIKNNFITSLPGSALSLHK